MRERESEMKRKLLANYMHIQSHVCVAIDFENRERKNHYNDIILFFDFI